MPEPRGWRLNRSALLRLLGQAGKKPANAKDLASTALIRLAVKHNLVSTASLCDLPDQVLTNILCMVASSDKLGRKRNAKGPSSLFSLACVHPRLDKLLCKDSDIWIIAWMMYRAEAKATDIRGHEVCSLSARDKLRLLSFQGCQFCYNENTRKVYWPFGVRMCDACFDRRALDVEAIDGVPGVWSAEGLAGLEEALRELPMYTKKMYNPHWFQIPGLTGPHWQKTYVLKTQLAGVLRQHIGRSIMDQLGADFQTPSTGRCRSRVEIVVLSDSDDCGLESDGDDIGGWVQQAPPQPWAQAATMEEAMAVLAAQRLPPGEAKAAADSIVARFMPDAFAALQPAAAAAAPAQQRKSRQPPAQRPPAGNPAATPARPTLPSAAPAAPPERSKTSVTPRKRKFAQAGPARRLTDAPQKRKRTVSRTAKQADALQALARRGLF